MYIAEVSPSSIRGRLVSLNQMTIVLGILGAQVTNWLIADDIQGGIIAADSWNALMGWRWMFWAAAVPSAAFFALALFVPESPRWLMLKGRRKEAEGIISKLGYGDIEMLEDDKETKAENAGFRALMRYGKVLSLGLFIAVFQQWCGTNVIFNYAQEIFQSAGYEVGDVLFNIVITGIANVVFTIVAINTVDRWGRRSLMLLGAGGLCLIYLALGCCYYMQVTGVFMIVLVVAAIGCYAMTLGPCTWVLISELFPNNIRALAVSICTFALWVASSTLTYTFPFLNSALGSFGTFWIYSAVCAIGFIFLYFRLQETKGKRLEEME